MAEFVQYELSDGSCVFFEASEAVPLVSPRSHSLDIAHGGRLGDRLIQIGEAASEICGGLREKLRPDTLELEFGVKISGEVNWWFFAKSQGEGAFTVRLTWAPSESDPDGSASE